MKNLEKLIGWAFTAAVYYYWYRELNPGGPRLADVIDEGRKRLDEQLAYRVAVARCRVAIRRLPERPDVTPHNGPGRPGAPGQGVG